MQCITSTRFNLLADVLVLDASGDTSKPISEQGSHEVVQDPRTGAIRRVWVPFVDPSSANAAFSVKCDVKAIVDGGIRVAGTTERFEKTYDNIDFVHMTFPKQYVISKHDRITNVRNAKSGDIIWVEEELDMVEGLYRSTIFDVLGVSPITDPFGNHIENRALMARVDLNAS